MMYRGSSPIFDIPEFPTLRRVKPLPKRRRTSDAEGDALPHDPLSMGNNGFIPSLAELQLPGPGATAEELLAHADSLSAHMALQSYYMPILGSMQDLLRSSANVKARLGAGGGLNGIDYDGHAGGVGGEFGGAYGRGEEDDEHGEGDYIDHLQQPGNTKKRKVPANTLGSPNGHDPGSGQSGGEEEPTERGIPTGRGADHDAAEIFQSASSLGTIGQRKGKITPATLAGLQHKEMLKSRKRQLAAVLGALSHGDTLALDQALSANYPFATAGFDDLKNSVPPRIRLSRRRGPRLARIAQMLPRQSNTVEFPECDFTFACPSATADRLIATKEEVAMLRNRFEAELARQAAKAAKLAASANKLMASLPLKGARTKRADRTQQRARTGIPSATGGDQTAEFLDQPLPGNKPRGGKKKKRSALANASNPHHLKNYVPSRLPHSGQGNPTQTMANSQNDLGPFPIRFLSADIPPRRRKKAQTVQPTSQLTSPTDEWICAFCEYELFYGDDQDYRRAIRSRKKILRRRRRARERAAAAASGNVTARVPDKSASSHEDYDVGFEPSAGDFATVPKQNKLKGETTKEGEKGSEHG